MRKVSKIISKEIEVEVCDVCGKEGELPFTVNWSENCPYDDCSSDWGDMRFCSFEHFKEGIGDVIEHLDKDEDFSY